jgi:hypothetical protein
MSETEFRNPTAYEFMTFMALQRRPMYAGTVPVDEVARRRAKNKVARKSRATNRKRAA